MCFSVEGIQLEDNSSTSEIGRVNSNYLTEQPPVYEPPPDYEAPPNYEEAIKIYKDSMKKKDNYPKVDLVNVETDGRYIVLCNISFYNYFLILIWNLISDSIHTYNMNVINNFQSINVPENNNSNLHCLCCNQASYHVLALDINKMNRCCLSKIYSLRILTINNQY